MKHKHAEIAKLWFEDTSRRVLLYYDGECIPCNGHPRFSASVRYKFAPPVDSNGKVMEVGKRYKNKLENGDFEYLSSPTEEYHLCGTSKGNLFPWQLDGAEPVEETCCGNCRHFIRQDGLCMWRGLHPEWLKGSECVSSNDGKKCLTWESETNG